MYTYDYLIVGAGLYGACLAYRLKRQGKRCLVIDKRSHVGGNIYTEKIEGINVHKYGAHIFHTSNSEVWEFVNSISPFNHYINTPVADYKGELFNLPFNMNTFYQMWGVKTPEAARLKIEAQRSEALADMRKMGIAEPENLEQQALLLVGRDIYEKLIKGYTEKQWGRSCRDLPAFIIRRLPVRLTFNNNYFNDTYQGIPMGGYTLLIDRLLEGVEVRTSTDFFSDRENLESLAERIIYSGPIDRFFDYRFGHLDYRSVRFETEVLETSNFQGNAVVNYTDAQVPYTRIIEHKHFEMFNDQVDATPKTVISREYSSEWKPGAEPFYPVNDERNTKLYAQYRALTENEKKARFGGRLAEYRYYDMDKIVEQALSVSL
ncbi:MAG: UDP-galactopyranose mutase [Paludibacteraceae bacterium]